MDRIDYFRISLNDTLNDINEIQKKYRHLSVIEYCEIQKKEALEQYEAVIKSFNENILKEEK